MEGGSVASGSSGEEIYACRCRTWVHLVEDREMAKEEKRQDHALLTVIGMSCFGELGVADG